MSGEGLPVGSENPFVVGIAALMVTGFWAVWFLLRYVRTRGFAPFVVYRLLTGTAVLAVVGAPL